MAGGDEALLTSLKAIEPGFNMLSQFINQRNQVQQQTLQRQAAYNALAKIYGPDQASASIASPEAFKANALAALQGQQGQLLGSEAAANQARLPFIAPQAQADIAQKQAQTAQIAPSAAAQRAQAFASASASTAAAMKTRQTIKESGLNDTAQGVSALISALSDTTVKPGMSAQQKFDQLAPQISTFENISPDQLSILRQRYVADPQSTVSNLSAALTARATGIPSGATGAGSAVDTAAQQYLQTGKTPSLGSGKSATVLRQTVLGRAQSLAVQQGIDPATLPARWQTYGARTRYLGQLADGSMNSIGGKLNSLNGVWQHIDTLDKFATALGNGNVQAANALGQEIAQQTGKAAPAQFDAQKNFVSGELVRFYTARGNQELGKEISDSIKRSSSPAQMSAIINGVFRQDLVAQAQGMFTQAQAEGAGDIFKAHLIPGLTGGLGPSTPISDTAAPTATTAPAQGGWSNFRVR